MMNALPNLLRFALLASSLGALGMGCSAAPDGEASGTSEAAVVYTNLPEAVCTRLAGATGMASDQPAMKIGGSYTGTDPNVLAFQSAIHAAGGHGGYTIFAPSNGVGSAWYAIDVTNKSGIASIVNQHSAAPVSAGYYHCTYLWGDFQLVPGQPRPYAPPYIVAYDPTACGGHCM